MKIGVDIRVLMDKHYSGVSKYTANLLSALYNQEKLLRKEQLESNSYRLFYNSWHHIESRLQIWENDFSEIKHSAWPNKIFNYVLQKIFTIPKLDKFLDYPDIFWSPHFNFSSFSKNSQTKKVITVHDLSFLRYPEFFSWRKNFWHQALNIKKILLAADGIVAVSENTKDDIMELLNIEAQKIKVIHSGIKLPADFDINESQTDFWQKHNLESCQNRGIILYVGTIEPRKNLVNLIKAYDLWRDSLTDKNSYLPLVLVGSRGWKTKKIFSIWKKSNYQKDIIFLGYVDDLERELLYRKANLFVYPSCYEGFGFPPLEAMARGVPVITSNVSSLPEVVADAALMVNPGSVDEIAQAMQFIFNDNDLRLRLIEKGRKRAMLFSWEETAKKYLEFFKLINNKN